MDREKNIIEEFTENVLDGQTYMPVEISDYIAEHSEELFKDAPKFNELNGGAFVYLFKTIERVPGTIKKGKLQDMYVTANTVYMNIIVDDEILKFQVYAHKSYDIAVENYSYVAYKLCTSEEKAQELFNEYIIKSLIENKKEKELLEFLFIN